MFVLFLNFSISSVSMEISTEVNGKNKRIGQIDYDDTANYR